MVDAADDNVSSLILGELLGEGVARRVYAYRPDPQGYVVKVQTRESLELCDFQNVAEWSLWQAADKRLSRWLAPCFSISPSGHALLQARCEPMLGVKPPLRVPQVLGDMHIKNLGVYEGRVVALDYGRHLAEKLTANVKAMRKLNLDAYTSTQVRASSS